MSGSPVLDSGPTRHNFNLCARLCVKSVFKYVSVYVYVIVLCDEGNNYRK